jgi:hypothetical protein
LSEKLKEHHDCQSVKPNSIIGQTKSRFARQATTKLQKHIFYQIHFEINNLKALKLKKLWISVIGS